MQEYRVGENQRQHYCFLVDETTSLHDAHLRFYVERNAVAVIEIFIAYVTIDLVIDCILQGEGADVCIKGVYMIDTSHKVTISTMQHHKASHANSNVVMKGIVRDNAQAHYQGIIRVEKKAQGTHAAQENKNIVMSSGARVVSVPSLEIFAHDVHCSHASATGKFDKEQLLYAASRGIDEKAACKLLLQAFVADIFMNEELKEKMRELIR
jgi:Fe-S cluster assembly scaffold protein SufB